MAGLPQPFQKGHVVDQPYREVSRQNTDNDPYRTQTEQTGKAQIKEPGRDHQISPANLTTGHRDWEKRLKSHREPARDEQNDEDGNGCQIVSL